MKSEHLAGGWKDYFCILRVKEIQCIKLGSFVNQLPLSSYFFAPVCEALNQCVCNIQLLERPWNVSTLAIAISVCRFISPSIPFYGKQVHLDSKMKWSKVTVTSQNIFLSIAQEKKYQDSFSRWCVNDGGWHIAVDFYIVLYWME